MSSESLSALAADLIKSAQQHLGDTGFGIAVIVVGVLLVSFGGAAVKKIGALLFQRGLPFLMKTISSRIGFKGAALMATLLTGWIGYQQLNPEQLEQVQSYTSVLSPESLAKSENPAVQATGKWLSSLSGMQTGLMALVAGLMVGLCFNRQKVAPKPAPLAVNDYATSATNQEPTQGLLVKFLSTRYFGPCLIAWPLLLAGGYVVAYDLKMIESNSTIIAGLIVNAILCWFFALGNMHNPRRNTVMMAYNSKPNILFAMSMAAIPVIFALSNSKQTDWLASLPTLKMVIVVGSVVAMGLFAIIGTIASFCIRINNQIKLNRALRIGLSSDPWQAKASEEEFLAAVRQASAEA